MFFFNDNNYKEETNETNTNKDNKEEIIVEYGNIPFITFICVILSKLAYLPDCGFLPRYEQIFGSEKYIPVISKICNRGQPVNYLTTDIEYNPIPTTILTAIKEAHIQDIFSDQKIYKHCKNIEFYTDTHSNQQFVNFIKYAKFFNFLNGSTNKGEINTNKNIEKNSIKNTSSKNNTNEKEYVKYISLAWSNYSIIYIVADKRTNSIFIIYRGTASVKGITSYINFNTFNKNGPCENDDAYIPGIFKITSEAIHTLIESISYLATNFLKASKPNSVKLFATGHSLGGAMATIFSYLYLGIRNNNLSNQYLGTLSKQIVCISVGAPRCINAATLKKFNHFMNQNLIMYRRLVTKGDPVPLMPHKAYFGYYHPGDNMKFNNGLEYCQSTYSGIHGNFINYNKSSNCKNKEDQIMSFTTENQSHDHLNYLYISYLSLIPQSINQLEIPREVDTGDTLMRVIFGSIKNKKVVFFNLVKSRGINYEKPLLKFLVDIHNQDILMTHKAFLKLISLLKPDNTNYDPRPKVIYNEEIFDTNDEALNFNCFTKYDIQLKTKMSRKNNHIKKGTRKKRV
jgi:hypothetical protein